MAVKARYIMITAEFVAFHAWASCPFEEVSFLRHKHRHKFFVQVKLQVDHSDRAKEFFMEKEKLAKALEVYNNKDLGQRSCEQLAEEIAIHFQDVKSVQVWEDKENGAEVYFD